jgi:hypothetical protein
LHLERDAWYRRIKIGGVCNRLTAIDAKDWTRLAAFDAKEGRL